MDVSEARTLLAVQEVGSNLLCSNMWVLVKRTDGGWFEMDVKFLYSEHVLAERLVRWSLDGQTWALY